MTMIDVRNEKKMKVLWAVRPQRASTSSQTVWHVGARRLSSIARMPKRSTWIVAPDAYQNGPETPNCHATFDDWRRVAAHCSVGMWVSTVECSARISTLCAGSGYSR